MICAWSVISSVNETAVNPMFVGLSEDGARWMGHSYLQVFTDVQADPVVVGVSDEAKANVRSAAVKITEQIHRFRATFRTQ